MVYSMNTINLLEFQKQTADYIVDRLLHHQPVIDCSVVGAGKTFIAMYALESITNQFIIVCPKIVVSHWRAHVSTSSASSRCVDVINYDKIKFDKCLYYSKNKWKLHPGSVIIFDEAHKLKGYKTVISELLTSIDTSMHIPYLISATIADSPMAFANVARMLGMSSSTQSFLYSFGYKKAFGNKIWVSDNNPCHLLKLHDILFHRVGHAGVRITHAMIDSLTASNDVKLMMIDDVYNKIKALYELCLTMKKDNDIVRMMNLMNISDNTSELIEMAETALINDCPDCPLLLERIESSIIQSDTDVLVKRLRLRQLIEMLKGKLIVPHVVRRVNDKYSVIVMLNFSSSIRIVTQTLENERVKCGVITGSSTNRDQVINDFQNDNLHVIVLNIKAAGVGISLHDLRGVRKRYTFISPSENIYELQQALGRAYRTGSKTDVVQNIVTVRDTVEEDVHEIFVKKLNNMNQILNGNTN